MVYKINDNLLVNCNITQNKQSILEQTVTIKAIMITNNSMHQWDIKKEIWNSETSVQIFKTHI